jgi:O-antigen ligase
MAAGVASGSLMWTNSRAGWLSLATTIIFAGFLIFCKIREKKALFNIFFTVVLILILIFPLYPRLYSKIYDRFTGFDRGSAKSRFTQFEVAFNIIQTNPILGIGINNYSESMGKYDDTEEGLATITEYPVHNIFLHIAAEIGIIGLMIFLWFLASIFFKGVIYVLANQGVLVNAVIGMLAGIFAFLIHGLFDTASIGSKMFVFVWFFAGIIYAIIGMAADFHRDAAHLDQSQMHFQVRSL